MNIPIPKEYRVLFENALADKNSKPYAEDVVNLVKRIGIIQESNLTLSDRIKLLCKQLNHSVGTSEHW